MIKSIEKNRLFLRCKAQDATPADLQTATDLVDTLAAHAHECVGMAANMIGVPVRIIAYAHDAESGVMLNPETIAHDGLYHTQEGCLSLEGVRETDRYQRITVRYQDTDFAWHEDAFEGFIAQIIQHEIDHTNGILI